MTKDKKALLQLLTDYIEAYPELRFGQAVSNFFAGEVFSYELFYMEDDKLLKRVKKVK